VRRIFLRPARVEAAGNVAEVEAGHQEQEQGDRKADANRQCLDSTVRAALVAVQEEQRRPETGDNHQENREHEVTHGEGTV
jgi:hypothetical protein